MLFRLGALTGFGVAGLKGFLGGAGAGDPGAAPPSSTPLGAELLVEDAPVVLVAVEGPDHVVRVENRAFRELFGVSAVDRPVRDVVPKGLKEQGILELMDRVYRRGVRRMGHEVAVATTTGGGREERIFNFVCDPLRHPDGSVRGVVVAALDVTEPVRARRAAELASGAKSRFLSVMSHEIRTPLNAVLGYTNLLRDGIPGDPTPSQQAYLDRIAASGSHLMTLINDVLDMARIESGQMKVSAERVLLAPVARQALSVIEPLVRQKGLTLGCETGVHGAVEVWADERRVRQVLVNLLSNASKFTDEGEVQLRTVASPTRPSGVRAAHGGPWAGIEVRDTGIGVPEHRLKDIFEPFVQAEGNDYTRTHQGTGLGLGISRRLARMMGGDLTVESQVGTGSTFTLWLPVATPGDAGPPDRRRGRDRRGNGERRAGDRRDGTTPPDPTATG